MPKTSSALFVPLAESLFLVLVFYFAASAVMDQTMPADFTPAMRSMLFSQLLLVLVTTFMHFVIAMADRSQFVLPEADAVDADDSQKNMTYEDRRDIYWEKMRKDLKILVSQRMDYRCVCVCVCLQVARSDTQLLIFRTVLQVCFGRVQRVRHSDAVPVSGVHHHGVPSFLGVWT
jgi:hypothetical protein